MQEDTELQEWVKLKQAVEQQYEKENKSVIARWWTQTAIEGILVFMMSACAYCTKSWSMLICAILIVVLNGKSNRTA